MGFFGGGASVDLASPSAIGSTTPNTGAFTTLSASGSASIGTTANYQCLNIAQATSNPSNLPFISLTNHGPATIYAKGGYFSFNSQNFGIHIVGNTASVRFGTTEGAASDVVILRENATGVLAQRAGTTAQTFRLYNTYTDASNYERGFMRWATNVLEIGAEAAGTGTNRTVRISAYDTIDFRNTQYGYSMGNVIGGLWTFNNGPQIANVCRMDNTYGFQAASGRNYGWVSGTNTAVAPDTSLNRNSAGVVEVNNGTAGTFRDLIVRNFRMSAPTGVPTANNSTGTEGSIRWDADYIYICTAANTWKRVAIATWP